MDVYFPCVESNNYARNKVISIFAKTFFNGGIFGLHTNLTEIYFNDVFLDPVKIMGKG